MAALVTEVAPHVEDLRRAEQGADLRGQLIALKQIKGERLDQLVGIAFGAFDEDISQGYFRGSGLQLEPQVVTACGQFQRREGKVLLGGLFRCKNPLVKNEAVESNTEGDAAASIQDPAGDFSVQGSRRGVEQIDRAPLPNPAPLFAQCPPPASRHCQERPPDLQDVGIGAEVIVLKNVEFRAEPRACRSSHELEV